MRGDYVLTGVICHIRDLDDADDDAAAAGAGATEPDAAAGADAAAAATAAAAGGAGGAVDEDKLPPGHLVAILRIQPPYLDPETGSMMGRGGGGGAAADGARPDSRGGPDGTPLRGGGGGGGGGGGRSALPDSLDDVFADLAVATSAKADGDGGESQQRQQQDEESSSSSKPGSGKPPLPPAAGGASAEGEGGGGGAEADSGNGGGGGGLRAAEWAVFNDFCITPVAASEVMDPHGGQKRPCVLLYTRADALAAAAALPPPPEPLPPAIDAAQFAALCAAPPLQGRGWQGPRTFTPLDMATEAPRPGMLVAIDAEFVAISRARATLGGGPGASSASDRHGGGGGGVQLRPSRLALARVSVLRGEGPRAGEPCVDDYVRAVDPVHDYLTRYSGIRPGDLDVTTSPHHLVTLKAAYLKLRYLLDVGCVFVGHGLKQDFRMLNLVAPPEQVMMRLCVCAVSGLCVLCVFWGEECFVFARSVCACV